MKAICECYILDVGQGSSNVILLGDGRAIVIDCSAGDEANLHVMLKLLKRYVTFIDVLAITHNDKDHTGGASIILAAYPKAIGKICFLQDRKPSKIPLYVLAKQEYEKGNLRAELVRLELNPDFLRKRVRRKLLWRNHELGLKLELIYPDFLSNLWAQDVNDKNLTSAVLCFKTPGGNLLFPGDCTMSGWTAIHRWNGRKQLPCDVFAVPHHGGIIAKGGTRRIQQQLSHLYKKILSVRIGAISVRTGNSYGHPRKEVVHTIRDNGGQALCTEITKLCCDDFDSIWPGVIPPNPYSLSFYSRSNVGCMGTIVIEICENKIAVKRQKEHSLGISTNPKVSPQCRLLEPTTAK